MQPLIIQLANLLHKCRDPQAVPVQEFIRSHETDAVFLRRAKTLLKLFKLKASLVK